MKTIHILTGIYGVDDRVARDVPGQRQLHQDAIYSIVIVQPLHLAYEVLLSNVCIKTQQCRVETPSSLQCFTLEPT